MPVPDLATIARRHGVSLAAAEAIWASLRATGGSSAQFNHPDLGGFGQWMPGMTQVGDMFNAALRARVDALCTELAGLTSRSTPAFSPSVAGWWPAHLGPRPDSAGGQNGAAYAWFAAARRLAILAPGGTVTLYDTGPHRITGAAQSQAGHAGSARLVLSTPQGPVDLATLPVVTA